jgi:RecJ-like exonuclease
MPTKYFVYSREKCPACNGVGTDVAHISSTDPLSGKRSYNDVDVTCSRCNGTKSITVDIPLEQALADLKVIFLKSSDKSAPGPLLPG